MNTLTDKQGRLAHLQKEWQTLWNSKPGRDFTRDEADNLKNWNAEMADLGEEIDQLKSLEEMARGIVGKGARPIIDEKDDGADKKGAQPSKGIGDRLVDSAQYKSFVQHGGQGTFQVTVDPNESKALLTLGSAAPQNARLPRIEPFPVEQRTVADLMMQGTIDRGTLEYYEETTFTNAAAETAEGATKPEAALGWTLRTESLSKIAVWIPATAESLQDIAWLESTIRNRLVFMVERRKEAQLVNGDGTAPNISGITDRSGIQTVARGADPIPDAILKAANLIRINSFYEPDAVVMHPLDMQDIHLLRTAEGLYIFGNPNDPQTAMRLWGLEVRETVAQTQNTAVVGAFGTAAQVFYRGPITVTASTEHSTYFVENKVAILAEQRLGLAVYRPNAFCLVTGV